MTERKCGSWSGRSVAGLALLLAAAQTSLAQPGDGRAGEDVSTIDHAIEVYVSDDAMQAMYARTLDLGEFGPTDVRGGFFYNESRDLIGVADLLAHVGDDAGVNDLELRVGTRIFGAFLAPDDADVFGISVGGEAQWFFTDSRTTSVTLGVFYSPDVITFGEADNFKDVNIRFTTRLRNGTDIFVGFRNLEIDLTVDREVDDNAHVGFRRSF